MTGDRSRSGSTPGVLRFDLGVQRNHLWVYTLACTTALIGHGLHIFNLKLGAAFLIWAFGCTASLILSAMLRRGVSRDIVNPLWMAVDTITVTAGVYATGGIFSPWYIWYVATSSAAAFAVGKRAAYAAMAGSSAAYIAVLMLMGQARFFDDGFVLAACRMLFMFGACYFFLNGVADLQMKRLRIRQLELEESRKVEELTRLTEELQRRGEELVDANRRIKEADRLKSQFLANMSHELRTPMNSIIGFSEILVERLEGRVEPKHLSFLRHILTSGQHLLSIINDVLDLSKIEAGKMEIYPETFAITHAVESVCSVTRGMTKAQPTFIVELTPDLPEIETDHAKFKQVLFNLLSNAVKFSPPDKPIRITAKHDPSDGPDGSITVSVHDLGIGIDAQHHKVIFEEFRQVDGSVRREFGGTGLGLALVRRFVELQGGHVGVESAVGLGSTFSFTLPLKSRAAVISRGTEPIPMGSVADRVLVVEDDANAYELIASALTSAGYLALRARHGEEALRLAREAHPTAVTLDLVLPGVDGWEVLKRLKSDDRTRNIPVVIISMVDNRELGVALGADDYFIKPVDRDRLIARVRSITSHNLSHHAKLLLIDDDAAVHALLDEELANLGYSMVNAYSGEEGLRAAKEASPDLIILDLMMPGMSGFEVAGSLKENPSTADIPILVLTSKDITSRDRDQLLSNVSSFVQKGKSAREQLVREIKRLSARAV